MSKLKDSAHFPRPYSNSLVKSVSFYIIKYMKIDSIYSSDLYDDVYGNSKYFNQRPWDVAMNKKVADEFKFYKQKFTQDVVNGKWDENEYLVLLKITLDGPLVYFENNELN